MRRPLLLPALALLAAPASAQTDDAPRTVERSVTIERDGDSPHIRRMIVIDGDTTITEGPGAFFEFDGDGEAVLEIERRGEAPMRWRERRGDGEAAFFGRDGERVLRLHGPRDGFLSGEDGPGGAVRLRMQGGPEMAVFGDEAGPLHGMMARMMGAPEGVSAETRDRMRELEREARALAHEARDGDAAAEAELDAVLAELFDVRAEARREQAAHLRAEADRIEAALADREARREALIEARRAELLGRSAAGW